MTDKKKTLRVGLIGSGGRAIGGYLRYFKDATIPADVVAIADPSERNIKVTLDELSHQSSPPTVYNDWKDMLDAESSFDGIIIATPNFLHEAPALASLDKNVKVLSLEKPLANTPEGCRSIVQKAEKRGVSIQLGFGYRYSPFFNKVKELLTNNAIGNIVTLNMDECVALRTSSVIFRGHWRRYTELSGGTLLEKCCHALDLLNWMSASRPARVSSLGGKGIFTANGYLPHKCDGDCPISDRCVYFVDGKRMRSSNGAAKFDDCCIYNADNDIADHQSVQIQYENGVVCNFMVTLNTDEAHSGMNIHIVGTNGRIWGNVHDKHIMSHNVETGEVKENAINANKSNHGGGDLIHAEEFLRLAAGTQDKPHASEYDAFLSAMLCFAAERSREERRQVAMRYPGYKQIELG